MSDVMFNFALEKVLEDDGIRETIKKAQKCLPKKALDINALCKKITGGDVCEKRLPNGISGYIVKRQSEDIFDIYYNVMEAKKRQRFTIAHELSHYLLHKKEIGSKYPENALLRGGLTNPQEVEANRLAADILMPFEKIEEYIDNDDFTIHGISRVFGVSYQAMSIRLGVPLDA